MTRRRSRARCAFLSEVGPNVVPVSLPIQLTFDELDTPLHETTFVVVDLETTGGSADTEAITEIGAVKVRGGEILGEFATLIDPGRSIPPYIVELTGITSAMLIGAHLQHMAHARPARRVSG